MVTTRSVELLTHEQVESVHEASLEILENVGLLVRNEEAGERFVKHGCHVDVETQIIKFPTAVVEHFRQAIPPTFTFHGRDPLYDRTIRPLVITGSSAPDIIDLQTGQVRCSRSDDPKSPTASRGTSGRQRARRRRRYRPCNGYARY